MIYLNIFKNIFFLILILISIAFFTLVERSYLGLSHKRLGPNKLVWWGTFQPFSDALKLFSKNSFKFKEISFFLSGGCIFLFIFFSLLMWVFYWSWGYFFYSMYSFIFLMCFMGFSVYFLLVGGWSGSSKYSMLGGYRSASQSISYEVVMILVFLIMCTVFHDLGVNFYSLLGFFMELCLLSFVIFLSWFFSCVAESNRSPFDFTEGESELVSGFNTEYEGGYFSLIFISEYCSIIFLSYLTSFLFIYSVYLGLIFSFFYLWIRSSYPRLRYDLLMGFSWKSLSVLLMGLYIMFLG